MRLGLLGPIEVTDAAGGPVDVGGPKERALLTALAVRAGEVVSEDALIDALWGDEPPRTAVKTLQAYVSRLRRILGTENGLAIESRRPGYVLRVESGCLDVAEVSALVEQARAAASAGDPDGAAGLLRRAAGVWRGRSLGEFADEPWASAEAARLEELRLTVIADRVESELAAGRHEQLVGELEALCAAHPLRERLWAQRMAALYRSGRQADALATYLQVKTTLAEELGLDPGPELQELERRILAQDPTLRPEAIPTPPPAIVLPSGVVTFLFTDIEGSSHLWENHAEAMPGALAEHDRLIREAVAAHGGAVVKSTGDGMYAVFATATPAVAAAVDAQRALASATFGRIDLRVRMALHSGEAQFRDGDYLGPVLNRAARLLATAHGGQVVCSQVTIDLVADTAAEGIAFVHLGEHRLRDLARPEHIFQITHPALPSGFPALRSLDAHRHNLPVQTTLFVSREGEVSRIVETLATAPVVTLVGPGGVGKTRLAVQAAAEALPSYPDGAWLCELAALTDGDMVPLALASALAAPPINGRGVLDGVIEFLRDKRLLLVVDNCEHLLSAVSYVVEGVAHTCPTVRILATSREALAVDGERSWPVRSLETPAAAERPYVDEVLSTPAVELFVDRAQAVRPDFVVTEGNAGDVAEICRKLDGIPLAIELAAARIRSMAPAEIAVRLDERFRLLTAGRRTALERHQTLRSAVTWSYDLLDERERELFQALSVFSGGFDLRAAEAVGAGAGSSSGDVLDALSSLVAKSMIAADETDFGTRYHLLETMRQYAEERLAESTRVDELRRRHAEHFLMRIREAGAGLLGSDERYWVAWVDRELGNVRAALQWAVAVGDTELAVGFVMPLPLYSFIFEPTATEISTLAESLLLPVCDPTSPGYADVVGWAGMSAYSRGDFAAVERYCKTAIDAAREAGRAPHPVVLQSLGSGLGTWDRLDEAAAFIDEALQVARDSGDPFLLGRTIALSPVMLLSQARRPAADVVPLAEEAVGIARALGIPSLLSFALYGLGWALYELDDDRATAVLEESSFVAFGGWVAEGAAVTAARIAARRGDYRELELWVATRVSLRASDNPVRLSNSLGALASLLADLGRDDDAAEVAGAILAGTVSGYRMSPYDLARASASRVRMGPEAYAAAMAKGAARSLDEVLDHAAAAVERLISSTRESAGASGRIEPPLVGVEA